MDHRYIDDRSVAQRYLDHTLSPGERARFEAHLVDCQECTDRVLLAGMFQNGNGRVSGHKPALDETLRSEEPKAEAGRPEPPGRLRYTISLTPGQLFAVRMAAGSLAAVTLGLLAWLLITSR